MKCLVIYFIFFALRAGKAMQIERSPRNGPVKQVFAVL